LSVETSLGQEIAIALIGIGVAIAGSILTFILTTKTRLAVIESKLAQGMKELEEDTDVSIQTGKVLVESTTILKEHQKLLDITIPIIYEHKSSIARLEEQVKLLQQAMARLEEQTRHR